MPKSPYMFATLSQTPIQILQKHKKLNTIKGSRPTHNYEPTLGQITPSLVLLSSNEESTTSGETSTWLPLGGLVKQVL